ncbi:hypothetical protein AN958_08293 [Leucoagaricus sp. SymC.cos]|nr:hypothetical protein AN958_08293 [Leucoagaricus sp. SymC.cos]
MASVAPFYQAVHYLVPRRFVLAKYRCLTGAQLSTKKPFTTSRDKDLPPIPDTASQELSILSSAMLTTNAHAGDIPRVARDTGMDSSSHALSLPNPQQQIGFFQNASNFSIHNPIMAEHIDRIEFRQNADSNVLEKMRSDYVLAGAEFDSRDRDDPPRCHTGTRTRFLDELQTHVYSGTRIIWLYGPAGVGKSAIIQTLAETISPILTCSTLFFSRLNKRDNSKKIFTTLAYNFATVNPEYRRFLIDHLTADPGFLDKSLDEQFKRLFILPFLNTRAAANAGPWVVMMDGIDEVNSEPDQCRVIGLIRESVLHHSATTPFVWIISSREEIHLKAPFSLTEERVSNFWKTEIPIGTEEASKSAEIYFRTEFARMHQHYGDMLPRRWPSEVDIVGLAVTSWGLFTFASTLTAYIAEEDPVHRLEYIKSLIEQSGKKAKSSSGRAKMNPFRLLDILYALIMSDVPLNFLPIAKSILGFSILAKETFHTCAVPPQDSENPNAAYLLDVCNILQLRPHTAYGALRKLHSVLMIPTPEKAHEDGVRFRHVSFADFLIDEDRSSIYHISMDDELLRIWHGYCRIAKQAMYQPGRVMLSWEPLTSTVSVPEFELRLARRAKSKWLELLIPRSLGSISKLYYWFCKHHAPISLRTHVVVRQFSLAMLDETGVDAMFRGVLMRGWACYAPNNHIDLTGLRVSEWDALKQFAVTSEEDLPWTVDWSSDSKVTWGVLAELLRAKDLDAAADITLTIMRLRTSEYFAVIGPCRLYPPFWERQISYLIFPYIEGNHA